MSFSAHTSPPLHFHKPLSVTAMQSIIPIDEKLQRLEHLTKLKEQIISIATALYGTKSSTPATAFDIIPYILPTPSTDPPTPPISGVALIAYTSPTSFSQWEIIARAEGQRDILSATEALLNDLRIGMGNAMHVLDKRGRSSVVHMRVLDVAREGEEAMLETIVEDEAEREVDFMSGLLV
ncbi:hypothetical protein BDV96DRAFT_639898 [Lophiotrema nucula]|uniref:Uncharacterized protein n=1 Tax=Lophiotrema nucula TaxID=690887 RepID=A0A6A5ZSF7_9PLEO|nr:hypothetical protein BDV96DRAFT_639898 [Lophiotrema nucula]